MSCCRNGAVELRSRSIRTPRERNTVGWIGDVEPCITRLGTSVDGVGEISDTGVFGPIRGFHER